GAAPPVLLIDELDRADEEFEAYLLELLSDYQISIPELGTVAATTAPVVVLTSNRTREIHDALRRRCLYHWLEYPPFDKELAIVEAKAPLASRALAEHVVRFVQALRREDLYKRPGVAETLDWAAALRTLGAEELAPELVERTLGLLLKFQEDVVVVRERLLGPTLAASRSH
ncbi:MAG TPA: MoxR family ATPase, partial [Thermoanaerobaculia bacterium]|nr:MoxR family ATPase [Thermoanaerobaculia bacterium]